MTGDGSELLLIIKKRGSDEFEPLFLTIITRFGFSKKDSYYMKKIILVFCAALLLFACDTYEERERERSAERVEEVGTDEEKKNEKEVEVETEE